MNFGEPGKHIRRRLHDLAQPLSVLTGLVDLMLLEMEERSPFYRDVQMMSQQLEQVLRIVGEIRHLAREATDAAASTRGLPRAF